MPALNQNFDMWQDRTTILIIPILGIDGLPYTETTPTAATWAMALNPKAPAVLTKSTGTAGGITLALVAGTWTASITVEYADAKPINGPQTYYHELSVTDNANDIVNVTIGSINFHPSLVQY